jgi:CubicO group peptidase (beta-lactamase class C family)
MKPSETSQGQVIEDVASAQKSVVSLLLGIALDKGLVQLDDAASKYLGTGWSKATPDAEQQITLRNLVTMTSGLNEQLEPVAQPGEQWLYNTSAYSQTLAALESASAMTANELTAKWLLEPIGMRDSKWVERAKLRGVEGGANRYGFSTSAYDLARFGLLMLAHGKWQDQQIVSAEYVRESTSPSQKLNLSYGYLWWLNGQNEIVRGKRTLPGPLNSSAPADMFAAMGALGRKCYVVPSQQLVVVRLGDDPTTPAQPDFDREFWRLLMLALPK